MIARFLGIGVTASLFAVAAAGNPAAAAGSTWQVVPSTNPQPHQVTDSSLASVSLASATDGWAVGQFLAASAISHPLAEHWNGSAFSRVTAPTPPGRQASLAGVDQLTATDALGSGHQRGRWLGRGQHRR